MVPFRRVMISAMVTVREGNTAPPARHDDLPKRTRMALQTTRIPWGAFFLALLGGIFCGLEAGPWQELLPCPGSGCRLFRDVAIQGISLWWFGLAGFAAIALLCLWRLRPQAYFAAAVGLFRDILLLVLMFFTAPCISCLGAALLFALVFLCLRRPDTGSAARYGQERQRLNPSILFFVWLVLFLANIGAAANEKLGAWAIAGNEDSPRRVYFSPSCPACREAVRHLDGQAAFIPLLEQEGDFDAIARMQVGLKAGGSVFEALEQANTGSGKADLSLIEATLLRIRLLRNKGIVMGLGFEQIPLIMINGMPRLESPSSSQTPPAASLPAALPPAALPPELNLPLGQCGNAIAPCDAAAP